MFLPLYGIMQEKPEKAIMKKFTSIIKKQPPARLITLGFALAILAGTLLLLLPVSVKEGAEVGFVDALFTSTSAVCVTGLIAIDVADHFTLFGQIIVALLIQIGGLGVTSVGMGFIIAAGRKVGFKGRLMVKEALNVDSFKGIVRLVKAILLVTLCFEVAGAALSFISFRRDFPLPEAVWKSIFHSIAAFNNAGFDILGGMRNLIPYQTDVLLNLTTCFLIIFGGLGFLVILDIVKNRSFRKLSFHSKIVLSTTAVLIVAGTLLLKATEDISWLGAFFQSVSTRTAGFSTYNIGGFSSAGLTHKAQSLSVAQLHIQAVDRIDSGNLGVIFYTEILNLQQFFLLAHGLQTPFVALRRFLLPLPRVPRSFGSSASRSASPHILKQSTTIMMAMPGAMAMTGWLDRYL